MGRRRHAAPRLVAASMMAALVAGPVVPTTSVSAATIEVKLSVSDDVVMMGDTIHLTLTLTDLDTGEPAPGLEAIIYGQPMHPVIASGFTDADGEFEADYVVQPGRQELTGRSPAFGTHTVSVVGQVASTVTLEQVTLPAYGGRPITFKVLQLQVPSGLPSQAPVSIRDMDTDQVIWFDSAPWGALMQVTFPTGLSVGTHHLRAEVTPVDEILLPSASDTITVEVLEDAEVDADAPRREYSAFYPYNDGFRDTIATSGVLREPGSIRIEVWNTKTNARVAAANLGVFTSSESTYSYRWSGRWSSGKLVADGTYRFRHVFTDALGNTGVVDSATFTLSKKRLVWSAISSVKKQGRSTYLRGTEGNGSISTSKSAFSGGIRLARNSGWAAVVYEFRLPKLKTPSSAVMKRVRFSVLGKGLSGGRGTISIYNETLGAQHYEGSYDTRRISTSKYAWHTTWTAAAGSHIDGRTVYGLVSGVGTFDINDVKVTYSYASLK